MSERTVRDRLQHAGYDPDEIEYILDDWAEREQDARRDREVEEHFRGCEDAL